MRGIIIFGEAGAGKDTVAKYIAGKIEDSRIVRIASPIKSFVDKMTYDDTSKRLLYQVFGEACINIFGEDVFNNWAYNVLKEYIKLYPQDIDPLFIIPDGRRVHEYHFWVDKGFKAIGVTAPPEVRRKRLLERDGIDQFTEFTHTTEKQAEHVINRYCDYVICNFYEKLDDLYLAVDDMLEYYAFRGDSIGGEKGEKS